VVEYKYTPLFTVIVISDLPAIYPPIVVTFKEALAVLEEYVKLKLALFAFPQKLVGIVIAPLGTPANVRTLVSFKLIWVVPLPPSSISMDCPAVVPPRLIGPDPLSAIINP
jgi:hypothetical protein